MRKSSFIVLFLIQISISLFSQSNQKYCQLQVIDSQNSEPLPFATILINGNQHKGLVTNLHGEAGFYLTAKDSCIQISYVGYKTRLIPRNQISNRISLEAIEVKIAEVVVYPGENPANRIIKKAVANRGINNPDNIPEYGCEVYNKSIYDYIIKEEQKEDSVLKDIVDFSSKNHLLLMESATERFYKAPDKIYEKIKKVRVSGFKDPSIAPLSTDIQPFHFYEPLITIFDIAYLNPISQGSHKKYFFLLEDTLYHGNDTTFIISYRPKKNTNFEGLKGFVHINTNRYAIENVVASPAEKKLMAIYVQQKYEFKNNRWFPKELKSELRWEELYYQGLGMRWKSESYIHDFRLNIPEDSVKYTEEVLVFDKLATKNANQEMVNYRNTVLSLKEQNTYHTMDSLGEKMKFDFWMKAAEKISEMKLPFKSLYIPLDKIYRYNEFEGNRLGLGLYTDDNLVNWFETGGWGAYGFKDKVWKYGADLKFYFDQAKEDIFSGSYTYDAVFPGHEDFAREESYIEGYFLQQADYSTQMQASFSTRIRYLQLSFALKNDRRNPQYAYSFLLDNQWVNNYEVTELGAQLRFAFKEKYIWQLKQKFLIETKWPVLTLGYKKGLKDFYGGEIDYDKLWVQVDYSYHFPYFGKSSIRFEGGKIWGDVPYSFLFSGAGAWNSSVPFFVANRFNTMEPNQFANNEIVNAYYSHNFGTLLFSTSNWKPKVMLTQAFGIGRLTNTFVHRDIELTDMNKGYYESGLVINDLVRLNMMDFFYFGIGAGAFYHYGYYASDSWENNIKFKLNASISF